MNFLLNTSKRSYACLYHFVAIKRLEQNDLHPHVIHNVLAIVLSTGLLMWGYAILALVTISSPIPAVIGLTMALLHLLSPLLFRFTNNKIYVLNFILGPGIIHQSSFAFFSGGFDSNILIWFGILPLLAGVINGKKGAFSWMVITLIFSFVFFLLEINGFQFPQLISTTGKLWAQGLLVFGWIFLSSTIVIVYAGLREVTEEKLNDQKQKIDDLFRVLFHDLANPLGRIAIGITMAKKHIPEGEPTRGLDIAKSASDSMIEITQNIRKMYAVSMGKANVDLAYYPLNSSIEYILGVYASEIGRKKIVLDYNFAKHKGLSFLVESVSFNNQVLGNIISNAIKFSPVGGKISIRVYPVTHDLFKLEIKDQGFGIPKDLLNQLFDINKKTSRPGTTGEVGTGFGMHIMKTFLDMYGAEIAIDSNETSSEKPSGTTIRITLKGTWN